MLLDDLIIKQFRMDERQHVALHKLGIETVHDLLFHFPARYTHVSEIKSINEVIAGELVTVAGELSGLKTKKGFRSKIPMAEATLRDLSGEIKILWFHQAFIAKKFDEGATVELTGKISENKNGLYMSNPEIRISSGLPIDSHGSLFGDNETAELFGAPVYPESRGITSKWLYHAIQKIIKSGILEEIVDPIPPAILKKYSLPNLKTSLIWIHSPKNENDARAAQKRFAFEEIFYIQLKRQQERKVREEEQAYAIKPTDESLTEFKKRFAFQFTKGQERIINDILADFKKQMPMARLLEGDVGSGKTAVAAAATFAVITSRPNGQNFGALQVAYMAPTEILATQLFENFVQYFIGSGTQIGLITGTGCRKFPSKASVGNKNWTTISRTQLLKWIANGEIPILIGTHALIQKAVGFKHLALVIIDEQHRFGTNQRAKLARKESVGKKISPHLLSMTATPIPRTLALTMYGDLDLSVLDEMPAGRKSVITRIIVEAERKTAYEAMREELKNGRQAYIICPRIDEPDPNKELALQAKSVTSEAKRLQEKIFPEYDIGILHSKMTKGEKESVMKEFANHEIDILVATSVVEVGVNVPNATLILIEGAERFGLAQLHQLRGRVIRSTHQAYCFLFTESQNEKTLDRLRALMSAKNGFELAEIDLELRGSGELSGGKQWGISDMAMEAIKNPKMVEAARTEAIKIIESDSTNDYPELMRILSDKKFEIHFE